MEIVKEEFNLFKHLKSIPQKKEPDISILLIGSMITNVYNNGKLTSDEKIEESKKILLRYGMYKTT